jgi:predicted alpha/beta superfamily hydrolase
MTLLSERRRTLACSCVFVAATAASAQSTITESWTTETVNSRALGKRTIYVATPEGYRGGKAGYPVVIMLDADDAPQFRLWIAQAAYLAENSPGLPPVIIVGIANGSDRIHDMTPPSTGSSVKEYTTAGGADAFAAFILDEVLPQVRAKYRTVATTILAGHSAAGCCARRRLEETDAFQGIIARQLRWFNDSVLVNRYADLIGMSTRARAGFLSGGEEPTSTCRRSALRRRWPRSILDALAIAGIRMRHMR